MREQELQLSLLHFLLSFQGVGIFVVLAEVEPQTLGVFIDAQSDHRVSYFQKNQATEEGERKTGRDRYRLNQ